MSALPVVGMPAGFLREVRPRALGAEQVRRLVGAPEIAWLRDLGVEEVEARPYVLRPGVSRVADVAAVGREEVAALLRLVRQRRPVPRRRRVEGVDRQPDDDRDHGEEGEQAADPCHQRRDQHPLARVADPAARDAGRARTEGGRVLPALAFSVVSGHQLATGGGAIASATLRVSLRRRSGVSVKIVMPTFTIWTIPERTIIAPKIPRAM